MKRVLYLSAAVLMFAMLPSRHAAGSEYGGVHLNQGPSVQRPAVVSQATSLLDGWNYTQPHSSDGSIYGAKCFGFEYSPYQSYVLERIEFYASGGGPVTVAIHQDDGSGQPTGPVLASVSYTESLAPGWQGANLVPSVTVLAGNNYYIRYMPVIGSQLSTAVGGTVIPHSWSYLCSTWLGPEPHFLWMARFHGSLPTSLKPRTWSAIKVLYR